jgi:hypothetical protein
MFVSIAHGLNGSIAPKRVHEIQAHLQAATFSPFSRARAAKNAAKSLKFPVWKR